ncbi:hypothetical protein TNCV_3427671 [Trichonephila clavipes]|nr:hypothetical protein TNCV_3427671 [Trichonephila clavipes]
MAARLDVVTPRVQTINNDPLATCTGHFTAGGSIKSRDNRWVWYCGEYGHYIAKLKTKIEKSSTFESDPDFVKTLIKNCIDERVSRNERDLEKQKIELAKLQLAKLEKEVELQTAKNKALSLNPAAKVEEKQFETLNKETATHIGIREAEDWFRPIDLAKECDIYISSRSGSHKEIPITYGYTQDPFKNRSRNFKPEIKENYPQYLERENKKLLYMR